MGCDIHQYAEYHKDEKWHAEQKASYTFTPAGQEGADGYEEDYDRAEMNNSGDRSRNYSLFGLLSEGVRYDTPHAFPAKGELVDASKEVAAITKQWGGDAHSHSFLTFQELREKCAELLLHSDDDAKHLVQMLLTWVNSFGPNPEGVADADRRVVFWFDN